MYYVWETVRGQQGSSQGNEGGWQRLGHRGSLGLDLGRQVRGGGREAASSRAALSAGLEPVWMRSSGAQFSEARLSVEPGLRTGKQESVPRSPSHEHSHKSPAVLAQLANGFNGNGALTICFPGLYPSCSLTRPLHPST